MATFARHVDLEWTGTLMDGKGTATAGTGAFALPVTFPSRIDPTGDSGTTPEEMLAGSHAVCFGMVLTNTIAKKGGAARRVRVTATVTADTPFEATSRSPSKRAPYSARPSSPRAATRYSPWLPIWRDRYCSYPISLIWWSCASSQSTCSSSSLSSIENSSRD